MQGRDACAKMAGLDYAATLVSKQRGITFLLAMLARCKVRINGQLEAKHALINERALMSKVRIAMREYGTHATNNSFSLGVVIRSSSHTLGLSMLGYGCIIG